MIDCAAKIRFTVELQRLIALAPPYLWGGTTDKGVDCSGFLFLAAHRAGLPVSRSTSLRMAQGFDGWAGENVKIADAESLDIPFFSWAGQVGKPHSHCGVLFKDKDGNLTIAHASTSKQRIVVVPMAGVFTRDLSLVRRL